MIGRALFVAIAFGVVLWSGVSGAQGRPVIKKLGTIDCDMVETTPIVFDGKLYRFEYVRAKYYKPNTTGDSYFRFVDVAASTYTPAFAKGYHLGSAHVEGDTLYVYAVEDWGASRMAVFWSKDMESWESRTMLDIPGWTLYNNSVCKGPDGFIMAFEVGEPPEVVGHRFTSRFAKSDDLLTWELMPEQYVHTKEFYSACPALRYVDGYFYNIYLYAYKGYWASNITRSKDLIAWEESPLNPILKHDDQDKTIAHARITPEQRERIAGAKNANNSDFDFCPFDDKLVINYSWGNQHGVEHLAAAECDMAEAAFLKAWFPEAEGSAP
ncbi:MAG: hypothetical protein GY851_00565 [bacterium]|nr:hypothetical protein [bacterium]